MQDQYMLGSSLTKESLNPGLVAPGSCIYSSLGITLSGLGSISSQNFLGKFFTIHSSFAAESSSVGSEVLKLPNRPPTVIHPKLHSGVLPRWIRMPDRPGTL